ncbi:hypothetical protein GMD78_08440 [Ornithinibacillus sp. L9]|uniref:Lipoprotein n=1 Tax=Ornithinibacillus caprae TaxID=2678566 RepID=A0A6N8FK98_9BACI|nr:hypothetical protein [Ornithinibacillus caprae]MUK88417.1 hypothetical protein [Ornithinibacillus caprae]
MKKSFMIHIAFLSILIITACSNSDELSGKTFDVSVVSSPNNPNKYDSIMRLEFSDGNIVKNTMGYEEGTYELKDDRLVIQFENKNESLEIGFTFEESEKDFSAYSAVISDSDFQIEDSKQVSKYQGFYNKLTRHQYEFIER